MQTFFDENGGIRPAFDDTWEVLDYDNPTTSFYATVKRTGADLSAVDFVVNPHETPSRLLLIEVKDFRRYEIANRTRLKPGELAVEIVRYALHTLAVLYSGTRARHKALRNVAAAILPEPSILQVVLLLEKDLLPTAGSSGHWSSANKMACTERQRRRAAVQTELKQRLALFKMELMLFRCNEIPGREGWSAVALPLAVN